MSVMIQIRNVPPALHRRLKARAAMAGMSLSDYLLNMARKDAEQPTIEEMRERLRKLPEVKVSIDPVDIIRAERDRP
jgi:antitoxin FitA